MRSLLLLAVGLAAGLAGAASDPELTADEIYRRVLANRFQSSVQELVLVSGDRAGRKQPIRVQMLWKRWAEGTPESEQGLLSSTLVKYLEPTDIRHTGYLVVNKRDAPNDQFIYLKSMRRTRRVNLRGETIMGTDLSPEDIVPREMDDADYARRPDEEIDGTRCYVVEATPKAVAESQYSRFLLYVETEHYVPLRTRYWDRAGVEIKQLSSPTDSIRKVDGVWLPIEANMRHLLDESYTRLSIDLLVPDPELPKKFFTQRQLESKKLRLPKSVRQAARHPRRSGEEPVSP